MLLQGAAMRTVVFLVLLVSGVAADAARDPQPPANANGPLTGRGTVTADFSGTPLYFKLELEQQANKVTGNFDGDKLEGSVSGTTIHLVAKDDHGGTEDATGTIRGDTISGTVVFTNGDDPTRPETHAFTATLVPVPRYLRRLKELAVKYSD